MIIIQDALHTHKNLGGSVVTTLQLCGEANITDTERTAEVNYFDSVRLPYRINHHDVFWFKISMDHTQVLKSNNTNNELQQAG
jgi:hypothetical protein